MFRYATVLVTYNRLDKLKKELRSLFVQDTKPQKIIIIDNKSTDGTREYMDSLLQNDEQKLIIYKRLSENLGGSRGFYEGIKIASQLENIDWIALGDDDIEYDANFFKKIASKSEANRDVLCFTGQVLYPDKEIQLDHRRRLVNSVTLKQKVIAIEAYDHDFYLDVFSFVGVVINKKVVEQVKLPEKDYFIWCDDTEYSLRVREQTKILNVSDALVVHSTAKPDNSRFKPTWKIYYGKRNTILMVMKHSKNPFLYQLLLPMFFLKDTGMLLLKFKYYRPFIKEMFIIYFSAYKDGITKIDGKNNRFTP